MHPGNQRCASYGLPFARPTRVCVAQRKQDGPQGAARAKSFIQGWACLSNRPCTPHTHTQAATAAVPSLHEKDSKQINLAQAGTAQATPTAHGIEKRGPGQLPASTAIRLHSLLRWLLDRQALFVGGGPGKVTRSLAGSEGLLRTSISIVFGHRNLVRPLRPSDKRRITPCPVYRAAR